ncbi:MAG: PRC-barrel domain-containing protein [bacterium]
MKLSTELKNLPVVSIAEGEEVGMVKDFIIDPVSKSIVALVIEDNLWEGPKVISFSLIHSIGDFAITTENTSSVVPLINMPELTELIKKKLKIIDGKVITRAGRLVGFVKEYSIDDRTGEIIGFELKSDANIVSPDQNVIPSDCVATIGKDIIIVDEDVETSLRSDHGQAAASVTGMARPAAPKPAPKAPAFTPPPASAPDIYEAPEPVAAPAPKKAAPADAAVGIDAESDVDIEELLDLDAAAETSGKVEEPISSIDTEEAGSEEGRESLSEIFERRQIKYMLGKKVSKDVASEDGRLIISQGETISDDVIKKAKASGKFLELSMNIEIEE